MQLMIIMKEAGVNIKVAGDRKLEEIPASQYINEKIPPRLGFKKEGFYWTFVGKGKCKYTGENTVGEEKRREERKAEESKEEVGVTSSIPQTYQSTQPTHISHHLAILKAQIINKLTQVIETRIVAPIFGCLNLLETKFNQLDVKLDHLIQSNTQTNSPTRPQSPIQLSQPQPPSPSPQPQPHSPIYTPPDLESIPPEPQPEPEPIPESAPQPQLSPPPHQLSPKQPSQPQPTPLPPPQTKISFFDPTDPLNPITFDPQHFSIEEFLDLPTFPTTTSYKPTPIDPIPSNSEATDSDPIPSPSHTSPPTQPIPEQPLPLPPQPTPTQPHRLKQMAVRPKQSGV
ncbi:hypothetical protein ACLOJK_018799 [Asimina triloba]